MSITAELQALYDRDGTLTPEQVVAEASAPDSPLHGYFEWDDSEAARRYRLVQARGLIIRCRATVTVAPEETRKVRAFLNIPNPDGGAGHYEPTADALSGENREVVLQQAMRELAALKTKYRSLIDFDAVLSSFVEQQAA